jgi:hypothetical protein
MRSCDDMTAPYRSARGSGEKISRQPRDEKQLFG